MLYLLIYPFFNISNIPGSNILLQDWTDKRKELFKLMLFFSDPPLFS